MPERDGDARGRQDARAGLGPLDERDRVLEVRLEVAPLGRRHAREAIEVDVRDVDAPAVAVTDREGRTRHRLDDADRATGPAHERRLARAELTADRHDVAGAEPLRQPARERLSLRGRRGRQLDAHPTSGGGSAAAETSEAASPTRASALTVWESSSP